MPCSRATRSAFSLWPLTMATTSKPGAALKAGTWTLEPKPVPMTPTRSRPSVVVGIASYHAVTGDAKHSKGLYRGWKLLSHLAHVEAPRAAALHSPAPARRLAASQPTVTARGARSRPWLARPGRPRAAQRLGDDRGRYCAALSSPAAPGGCLACAPAAAHHICRSSLLGRGGGRAGTAQDPLLQEPLDRGRCA